MREKRGGWKLALWIGGTLAVLLGLYVGAYYAMVVPVVMHELTPSIDKSMPPKPHYRGLGGSRGRLFFAPIHWLDRGIRFRVWNP